MSWLVSRLVWMVLVGWALWAGRLGYGQAPAADAKLQFETATVKPSVQDCCTSSRWSADRVVFTHQMLFTLVLAAYELGPEQLIGPEWIKEARFDVVAQYPPGTRYADRLLMLRTLLEERFRLVAHREMKEMGAYELAVGPGGLKLGPSEAGEGSYSGGVEGGVHTFRARRVAMFDLAYVLGQNLHAVVVDRTGLEGRYSFTLSWAVDDLHGGGGEEVGAAPPVFRALEEGLGLRLERRRMPVPVVVVDSAERVPAPN